MKRILFILLLGFTSQLLAGVGGISEDNQMLNMADDSPRVELPFPIYDYTDYTNRKKSRIDLADPSNIKTDIVYNPETDSYEIIQKIGDRYYRYPTSMKREEYLEYQRKKALEEHLSNKIDETNEEENNILQPSVSVKSEAFKNIFGSDEISIRPQGTAELSFGVNVSRYDNPALPEKQRRVATFDFQQQIQLNMVGQIGDKLKLTISQNTQATFNFQNQVKIEYTGYEDEIIQKIEAGNVSLPLNTTLIQGSQSLFGIRTDLKFGRLTAQTILSQQKAQRQEINVAGGAQVQDYEVEVDNYEANKHYFLNYYHREHYDSAMRTMPIVSSGVFITKIEVWVTNRINRVEDTRNFIAFTDLGEGNPSNFQGFPIDNSPTSDLPNNDANSLYAELSGASEIREFSSAVAKLASYAGSPGPFVQSVHYEKVENARQLSEQEFTYNAQLGFVSLRSPLNQDEVLGVAYQYTLNGRTYQVGEFTNDVPVQEGSKSGLILKLLKATVVNPSNKTWDLMMKNVYSIGAYQVSAADFTFDIWYNNPSTSVNINYLPYEGVNDVLLMQQLDLDRLNLNQQLYGDGRFDFVPIVYEGNRATNGGTIDPRTGRVYFTTVEPFGNLLYEKLRAKEMSVTEANRIAFTELYDSTKTAAQQIPSKNRFLIKGSYKSSVSSEISLNALNVPEGSVSVTAGGAKLTEGVDYTVDYNLGRVRILNQGILESQTPIKVQLESNSYYGIQSKSLVGAHFNYEFNKDFNWGATVMNLTEKPLTTKVNIGDEPMSNTVIGTDISYRTDAPFLTKLVDYLPFISTKEKSSITAYGEFAYLIPGTQRAISKEGVSYIDGFEGSQSSIDLRLYGSWRLASVPQGQADLFPESAIKTGTQAGFNRSQLAWYQIDFSTFYQNSSATPDHLKDDEDILLNSQYHQLAQDQLFPNNDVQVGTLNNISVLDLAYYPKERGAYNYDTTAAFIDENGEFNNPEDRWGGIMRALSTTNFETANVQFIQFWMLDPFNDDATDSMTTNLGGGDLYFNLGNISEDVLPDSRKSFESGLPTGPSVGDPKDYDTTAWAAVSNEQVIVNAFDNDGTTRTFQDVGLDGFGDEMERVKFSNFVSWVNSSSLSVDAKAKLLNDPSSDNFNYYRDDIYDTNEYNILRRYKYFNGMEGNSATSEFSADKNDEGYPTAGTLTPDIEDLNQDNNLSETESYFQYKVSLKPTDMQVGRNYITNEQIVEVSKETGKTEKWYQFKIPIENPDDIVNGIADFRSIRFMRMFLQGFDHEVVLRFAKLELIRGQWRKYQDALTGPGEEIPGDPNGTEFNLAAVNLEENAGKSPVGYIIPPNIVREQDQGSLNLRQLNEQSLSLEICGLQDGDARAAYKNVQFDVRSYKKLKMFVHGEARGDSSLLKSDQLTTFIRLGTDFDENYYEYEMPVKLTPWGTAANALTAEIIWPIANDMEIVFDSLLNLKMERDRFDISTTSEYVRDLPPNDNGVSTRIKVKGNPNLQGMKVIMIGVRNPSSADDHPWQNVEDGQEKCAEIWVNELRLTDFDQTGGWASTARVNMQLADFANVNLAGNYSTPGWGALESKVSDRQRETQMSFDASSNIELGQFFGNKIKLQIPFYVGYSVSAVDPQYDLLAPDIPLKEYDLETRRERAKISRDITRRKSYNFTNVRRERPSGKKVLPWNIENWSASYSYNELYQRDINTDHDITKTYRGGLVYNYSAKPILVEPFKKVSFLNKSKWFSIIKDFNFYVGPKSVGFNTDLSRMYNERQNRNALDTNFIFKPTYLKNFTWNRNYDLKYDLSKNIKFTFSANNSAIILEPGGAINKDANQGTEDYENYQLYKSSIRSAFEPFDGDSIKFGGYSLNYGQSYDLSYKLPLDKLPLTDWISANAKLRGSYDWRRAPLAVPEIGHTIQNSRNFTINSQFNMVTLYNKIGFFEKINNDGRGGNNRGGRQTANRNQPDKNSKKDDEEKTEDSEEDEDGKKKKKKEREGLHPIVKTTGRLIMSFRNFTFNYSENDGMLLPGYAGETSLFGMDNFSAPSFAFTAGQQNLDLLGRQNNAWGEFDSYAPYAASRGWLVENSGLNIQHTISHTQSINARAAFEPFKDLKINLTVDRKYTENENSYYRYNDTLITDGGIGDWEYQNVVNGGSISYTTITWKTAFQSYDDEDGSKAFQELRAYRTQASKLLGEEYGTTLQDNGYYDGFGENQQDVLINSFLAAYTGRSSGNKLVDLFSTLPLPNWDARYDGLSKMSFLKDRVKNFTLSHAYRSNVSVASFQTNLGAFDFDGLQQRDASMNFISETQMQSVTISEQFSPLIGVNATWTVGKNGLITNFEYKRDRSMALNVSNLQIIEMHGTEYVIGGGYKFSKVKLPIKISGKTPESDLTMRLDLSIRDNVSLSRNIIEDSRQFTSGQKMYSIKAKVDYNIGPNLNIALYFDRVVNKPKLSTAFNTANTRAGISLIFNLAQ
ncbi:T9SS outer membrane translocon Sov/SprA [Crocinitomix catalasitica]|uniref:T9SS outer membrane translocon Sov/SprA n=1 Tax=Crocinitomix catalasitica TaxID=184607 RepID=UPI0006880D88|nr:cell surface protein SprA [Crocinitomix catalasitica]